MRQSFIAALFASMLAFTALLVFGLSNLILVVSAPIFLTILWLAHLSAYTYRAMMQTDMRQDRRHNPPRRAVVNRLAKVFIGAAIASSMPVGLLQAQQGYYSTPGCRSCRVACGSSSALMCCPEARPFPNYCDCNCYQSNDFNCDRGYADCRGGDVCSYPNMTGLPVYYETYRCFQ
jgi:hypothetical protein